MAIGDATGKQWSLYIVRKTDDPPTSQSKFTDYSGYVIDWKVEGGINRLAYFSGTFASIETDAEKADVSQGNLIYILAGQKLIGKFVINKPIYNTDFTVTVTGYQSSGTELMSRKLERESYERITFNQEKGCDILKLASSDCHGITVDTNESQIIDLDNTNYGGDDRWAMSFDYPNRIEALNKFSAITQQEWWVEHGTNDATPYSEGDVLNVASREGSAISTKTFYFTGVNLNAAVSSGGEDTEINANHVIIQGQDYNSNQVIAETSDASANYTPVTAGKTVDGWLSANITATATTIPLTDDSMGGLWAHGITAGNCAYFRIDSEFFYATGITNSPTTLTGAIRDSVHGEAVCHRKGSDVAWINYTCVGNRCPVRIYVDTPACISNDPGNRGIIGSECFSIDKVHGANYICAFRGEDRAYAHGDKIFVKQGGHNGCYFCPSNPDTMMEYVSAPTYSNGCFCGSTSHACAYAYCQHATCLFRVYVCCVCGSFVANEFTTGCVAGQLCRGFCASSISECGLYTKTIQENNPANLHNLDLTAQYIVLAKRLPIKKVTINVAEPIELWQELDMGDSVTLSDGSEVGFSDGEIVRVTGYLFEFDGATESLQIYCNDKDTQVYASTDSTYAAEKRMTEGPKQQASVRELTKFEQAYYCPYGQATSLGLKRMADVQSPIDDFDAANKKYVDACIGSGGLWIQCTANSIKPCTGYCYVLPVNTVSHFGTCCFPWWEGFFGECRFYAHVCSTAVGIAPSVPVAMLEAGGTCSQIGVWIAPRALSGDSFVMFKDSTGVLNSKLMCVCDPTVAQDAATKHYVDLCVASAGGCWTAGTSGWICPCSNCSICGANICFSEIRAGSYVYSTGSITANTNLGVGGNATIDGRMTACRVCGLCVVCSPIITACSALFVLGSSGIETCGGVVPCVTNDACLGATNRYWKRLYVCEIVGGSDWSVSGSILYPIPGSAQINFGVSCDVGSYGAIFSGAVCSQTCFHTNCWMCACKLCVWGCMRLPVGSNCY